MKPDKLDINDWQRLLLRFKTEMKPDISTPVAMRIENTMFTSARYSGGMKYNGALYTYFEPIVPHASPNPDGSPFVAWLMVRYDFLKWAKKQKKVEEKGE